MMKSTRPYHARLKQVIQQLHQFPAPAALLLGNIPVKLRPRGDSERRRTPGDLYYLTGAMDAEFILLVTTTLKRPLMLAAKAPKEKEQWRGATEDIGALAASIGAELLTTAEPHDEVLKRLSGISHLVHQNDPSLLSSDIARQIFSLPAAERGLLPSSFHHSTAFLEDMRLLKDEHELHLIEAAAAAVDEALRTSLPLIEAGTGERQIREIISYSIRMSGAEPAFDTVVAAGPTAATIHPGPGNRIMKKEDLVVIDCGAEHQMYSCDITRTLPVSGKFSPVQRALYQAVLDAEFIAMSSIKDGVTLASVHRNATHRLIEGLIEVKVLKGAVKKLFESGAYKPYFPHGISHTLGLDFYDVGNARIWNGMPLRSGMVLTIEPGLYFAKAVGKVTAPCGIRIEDDIVVTDDGCEILTEGFPREIAEIEELMAEAAG